MTGSGASLKLAIQAVENGRSETENSRPARQCLDAPIGPEQQASHADGQRAAMPLLRTFVDIRSKRRIGYTCFEKIGAIRNDVRGVGA